MSSLPEEIYLDILVRVPVKSLLICKCVCKSWFSIISNPDFVKSHLNLKALNNNCYLMLPNENAYISYDLSSSSKDFYDAVVVELDFPWKAMISTNELLGTCNGLVYGWNRRLEYFFLWNPATNEYKRLPKSDTYNYSRGYHGLGYDYKMDDYRLVRIRRHYGRSLVQVYSLKSNSWKSFQSVQHDFYCSHESGVLFNGALHWFKGIKSKTFSISIISMDMSEERFVELQLPVILPKTEYNLSMGVLEGYLCVLAGNEKTFEVWVLQDYGVLESWTKVYTITYESIMCESGSLVKLIGSTKNGKILFRVKGNLISYDSKSGTARKTEFRDTHWGGAVKYFESLVSPKVRNH